MSFQTDIPLEQGPIQRLLIAHLKLAELFTGGHSLDESASTDELREQILYFYSSSSSTSSSSNCSSDEMREGYSVEEAIEFTGLCSALYSLPSSLVDPTAHNETTTKEEDRAREIVLDNCCFVFEPLENDPSILAVAQVARRSPHVTASHGGTPSAVGLALQQSHRLFCLLRGGGIHKRLVACAAGLANIEEFKYGGMQRMYQLRKQARKLGDKMAKLSKPNSSMMQELQRVEEELEMLLPKLPIRSLREDLSKHYNSFLGESAQLATENGSPCRCLVQALPPPIALTSRSHLISSSPPILNSNKPNLGQAMDVALECINSSQVGDYCPRLIGISTFAGNQLVFTHTSLQNESFVSNETACTLMGYLASFRFEMRKQHDRQTKTGVSTPPRFKQPFRPLAALSFSTGLDEAHPQELQAISKEGFLAPPSLSLLSPSDEGHGFSGRHEDDKVWAPLIDLPLGGQPSSSIELSSIKTRVCLYDNEDLSFLLYILPVPGKEENDTSYKDLFHEAAMQILNALWGTHVAEDAQQAVDSSVSHTLVETRQWEQPGREIIYIDRSDQTLVLFSHRNRDAGDNQEKSNTQQSATKHRFSSPLAKNSSADNRRSQQRAGSDMSSFDCRHLLASRLSLDTCLAFEDVMNEIYQSRNTGGGGKVPPMEICTFLPHQGWVYATADGDRELYVLFDPALFVTVADVQSAAVQLWKELVGGWID